MKKRNIIHDQISRAPIHVIYRLAGSIAKAKVEELQIRRSEEINQIKRRLAGLPAEIAKQERRLLAGRINAQFERSIDELLDSTSTGPFHLHDPIIAKIIMDSWQDLINGKRVNAFAICLMGNHVHIVLERGLDKEALSRVMASHKKYTARRANLHLGLRGRPFWEGNYFDRSVRKGKFMRVMWYVLNNPVKAGLVADWRDWPHTWVHGEWKALFWER